nr:putative LytR-membrane bound transcriptional regulator [Paulinella micropora]AQX45300.1 putative LytR-membrane bound transcriptional regulator [Paulinella micropora]
MEPNKQLKEYIKDNTINSSVYEYHIPLYHVGKVSFILIFKTFLLCSLIFKIVWPSNKHNYLENVYAIPRRVLMTFEKPIVLLICAREPITADNSVINHNPNILLLVIQKYHPVEILVFPKEMRIQLPGQISPLLIEEIYQLGNINLMIDALEKATKLPRRPTRYLIMPSNFVARLLNNTQGIQHSLLTRISDSFNNSITRDRREQLRKVSNENSVYKDNEKLKGLIRQKLYRPDLLLQVPHLLSKFSTEIDTNLDEAEALTVAAAVLNNSPPLHVKEIPFRNKRVNICYSF